MELKFKKRISSSNFSVPHLQCFHLTTGRASRLGGTLETGPQKNTTMKTKYMLLAAALGLGAFITLAQDDGGGRPGGPPRGGLRPVSPVIAALDANSDGEIDATEIANAPAVLRKLDKNGDGKLSADEIRPQGLGGPGGRPRGPSAE